MQQAPDRSLRATSIDDSHDTTVRGRTHDKESDIEHLLDGHLVARHSQLEHSILPPPRAPHNGLRVAFRVKVVNDFLHVHSTAIFNDF